MIDPRTPMDTLRAALARFVPVADAHFNDPWWIIGSTAMLLDGVGSLVPNDIDVLCSRRDAQALDMQWSAPAQPMEHAPGAERFRSHFRRFVHADLPIEVMGDLHVCVEGQWIPLRVESDRTIALSDGVGVRIPTRPEQQRILMLFGREKDLAKARLIASFSSPEHSHVH